MAVKPMSSMDPATVVAHFNARHVPYAGLTKVIRRASDPDEKLLRAYHQRVHEQGTESGRPVNHEHSGEAS